MSEHAEARPRYRRILLKLSGEALQNKTERLCIDAAKTDAVAARIKTVVDMGVQVGIVVGGGNIFRGLSGQQHGIDRSAGDYMGMMATVINGLALQYALRKAGLDVRVISAIPIEKVADPFVPRRVITHLNEGRVVVFVGGTGNPFFSTDTAAALRASEIEADAVLKATKVDGVYDDDPATNPQAKRFTHLTYHEALRRSLRIMDAAAFSLCMENHIPIVVFNFFETDSLERLVSGATVGTLVSHDPPA